MDFTPIPKKSASVRSRWSRTTRKKYPTRCTFGRIDIHVDVPPITLKKPSDSAPVNRAKKFVNGLRRRGVFSVPGWRTLNYISTPTWGQARCVSLVRWIKPAPISLSRSCSRVLQRQTPSIRQQLECIPDEFFLSTSCFGQIVSVVRKG